MTENKHSTFLIETKYVTQMEFCAVTAGELCVGELGIEFLGSAYGHEWTAAVIIGLHS